MLIRILAGSVLSVLLSDLPLPSAEAEVGVAAREAVRAQVEREYPSLFDLYRDFHAHPELSFQEERSAARLAEELRRAGFDVTTGVGRFGVVALFRNGSGPTVLVRSDLDALPVKEQTGLSYASTATSKDASGNELPIMHACGHDVHMTCLIGLARVLAVLRSDWSGTLVLIGQPAEEIGGGARAMLADGLFQRFPRPDFCLALHDSDRSPAGTLCYTPGAGWAAADAVDLIVWGVGGHGAQPDKTRDPVVLASQIVLALQTIVSREVAPGEPAVVTVGSIHGGTKRNIIPDEVRLQLTVRSYTEETRQQTLNAIRRIARGQGIAAGLPENRLPEVILTGESLSSTYNDPELTRRLVAVFRRWFGEANVIEKKPLMVSEDFGEFGRVEPRIPSFMYHVGAVRPETFNESPPAGKALPSLHSPFWAPVPEPTIKTGIASMAAAVLELLPRK